MVDTDSVGIVVVGSPQVGKKSVISRLIGHSNGRSDGCYPWPIETKYYTALTHVLPLATSDAATLQGLTQLQAVALVFDAGNERTFQELRTFNALADTDQIDIKLCIANKVDLRASSEASSAFSWLEDVKDWCIQERYEYVEVSATNEHVDKRLAESEDQHGMARVVAALHAHTWPGLVRREPPQCPRPSASANCRQSKSTGTSLPVAAPDCTGGGAAADDTALDLRDMNEGLDGLDEKAVDQTDRLFAEMSGMRERLQDLPDAERRTAAAEFALRLLGALEMDDDSEQHSSDCE